MAASGSAYVFERNFGGTDNWGERAKLTASDAAAYDAFGGCTHNMHYRFWKDSSSASPLAST